MASFTPNEWFILLLVFVLGLLLGMAAMAGGKWKRLYREEVRKRQAAEAARQAAEADSARYESEARQAETRATATATATPVPPHRTDTPIA
jgi:Tfp pilus assembly protein PilX